MKIHPNARTMLLTKKSERKKMIEESNLREDLLEHNICPKCTSDLNYKIKKWYKIFTPDYTRTCPKCGFEQSGWFNSLYPTGPR